MIVRATHLEGWQFALQSGGHHLVSDQSPQYGGGGLGPRPTELLLWAVAACFGQAVRFVASRMRKTVDNLALEVEGIRDQQAHRFAGIRIAVSADCPAETLRDIATRAQKHCYVTNSLLPGISIVMDVRVGREQRQQTI